jgi:hypothetical protein
MHEQTGNAAARGRAAAQERRRAIAQKGGARKDPGRMDKSARDSLAGLSGRELARARRAMLAQGGKNAAALPAAQPAPKPVENREPPASVPEPDAHSPATEAAGKSIESTDLDSLCEIVEQDPAALGGEANRVRQLCRARRHALATQGKAALPDSTSKSSGQGRSRRSTGREAARQHREALCRNGRGDAPACRPSGRMRPRPGDAPPKVEVGTTLSGQAVTGSQMERTSRVTGNESGGCRMVTGTEYVGSEQYATFCEGRPEPSAPKVGESGTSRGQWVTGNELGRSRRVTGDEAGSCKPVTGTEYLGSEKFAEFCPSQPLPQRPEKVSIGATEHKGMVVTGSDEARANRTTGNEPGARRAITGSQYADAGVARLTINGAPSKVALTHTIAGRPVSGTEVGRSVKVTGDEAGACRGISGTEYLSNEQFQTVCGTRPAPTPAKVGVDSSRGGQEVTGNLVDRTEKVTGNEPGSCQRVTGSQYGESRLCGGGVDKVREMHTLSGRALTGSTVDHAPKMSGDERGGCLPVTGTEYHGQEQYREYCEGTPMPVAPKVGVSQTPRGQLVSGAMLGHAEKVTGDEPGSTLLVSGTPYAGREQVGCGCGCNGSKADTCRPASRRFQPPATQASASRPISPEPAPDDFSIVPPAREARSRITGNAWGTGGRITGPVNLAAGLISGTPEFRYREDAPVATPAAPVHEPQAERITGEGREDGTRITGDDWARSGRVTGTEGRWAQGRNPTLRGAARDMAAGARANKEIDRPEVPQARITGSSGNASKGSLVTYSGGARG